MHTEKISFSNKTTSFYFGGSMSQLKEMAPLKKSVIITDENIFEAHWKKLKGCNTIVLKAGEEFKKQATVDSIVDQLIAMNADRAATLIGVGGGVVTDITGYVASVYLRGVEFGFVPTSLLAMVDAAIGGKNGVDVGMYKNMIGTISQPKFILYDIGFLKTLPAKEWRNGFAEIIKHAAIKDAALFKELEATTIKKIQSNKGILLKLVQRNTLLKTAIVQKDEFEQNERRLLNFGHTLGHALEKQYELSHGEAVAIGMCFAAELSQELSKFKYAGRVLKLVDNYGLPTEAGYDKKKVFPVMCSDKKKEGDTMNFILLEKIGKAVIKQIPLEKIYNLL